MSLAPGDRLGPYEVLAPPGAGGMGEVYRARDPRLGREVAVKVLPAGVPCDPDRVRRFELYLEEPQVSRDGRTLVYARATITGDIWLLRLAPGPSSASSAPASP